jgi:uncharacterized protein YbaP (TraB family)
MQMTQITTTHVFAWEKKSVEIAESTVTEQTLIAHLQEGIAAFRGTNWANNAQLLLAALSAKEE